MFGINKEKENHLEEIKNLLDNNDLSMEKTVEIINDEKIMREVLNNNVFSYAVINYEILGREEKFMKYQFLLNGIEFEREINLGKTIGVQDEVRDYVIKELSNEISKAIEKKMREIKL